MVKPDKILFYLILAGFIALQPLCLPAPGFRKVSAKALPAPQRTTAMDIINAVNGLRASQGLAPYSVDAGLMEYAQQHADYQASIDNSTHTHSNGSTAWDVGLEENIAAGDNTMLTAEYAVFVIWQDPIHLKPMVGFVNGAAGAGVARNGSTTYFTFNVRPAGTPVRGGSGVPDPNSTPTPFIPIAPLVTATPRADGTIWHEVGYGQTLWEIARAYGVEADALCGLNSMEAGCTEIYAGVRLLIRWKGPTPSPQAGGTTPAPVETGSPGEPAATRPADAAAAQIATSGPAGPEASPTAAIQAVEIAPTGDSGADAGKPAGGPGAVELLLAGLLILAGGALLALVAVARAKGSGL